MSTAPQAAQPPSHEARATVVRPDMRAAGPVSAQAAMLTSLQMILKVEHEARQAEDLRQLWHLLANEGRKLLNARQVYVFDERHRALAASSIARVDRQGATVVWIERAAKEASAAAGAAAVRPFALADLPSAADPTAKLFPFPHLLMLRLSARDGREIAYALAAREQPFTEAEAGLAGRIAASFGHAAEALGGGVRARRRRLRPALAAAAAAATAAALLFVKVPLTVLAPAEIVARQPMVVAAPIDGVIDALPVDIGQSVRAGDPIVQFADVQARNQLEIAEQELAVAEARWRQVSLAAFTDASARRDLATAQSEMALKRAERDYARDILRRTTVTADRDGIAIFADKRELIGRPVQTGQRLMEIADPKALRIRINVAVDDAMPMKRGAALRMFPDSDPLNPVSAVAVEAGHQARQLENGSFAFRVEADVPADALARLQIGHRGAAQIFGDDVSLGFYLFRRPISWLRQKAGL
jgi:multidrug resistance efflux pump